MTEINEETTRKIADLARLDLRPEEVTTLTRDLGQILGYVAQITEADVEGVSATAHAQELTNGFRKDEVRASLDIETAMQNAPDRAGRTFRVPRVIGDS